MPSSELAGVPAEGDFKLLHGKPITVWMRRAVVSELMKLQKREVQETSEVDSLTHLCKEKVRILKEFSTDSKSFSKRAGYLSGPDKGSH